MSNVPKTKDSLNLKVAKYNAIKICTIMKGSLAK